jgi:hypothetical protein
VRSSEKTFGESLTNAAANANSPSAAREGAHVAAIAAATIVRREHEPPIRRRDIAGDDFGVAA